MYANLGVRPGELHWYYYPGIVGHYFSFFGGIFFMVSLDINLLFRKMQFVKLSTVGI